MTPSTLLLRFDRELDVASLPGFLDGHVVVVADGEEGALPFARLRGLRADPALRARSFEQVVVHTLEHADLVSVLAAVRYGGRVFHLVDAPGVGVRVGRARAVGVVAARRLRRAVARLPLAARLAGRLGIVLDPGFPGTRTSVAAAETVASLAPAPRPPGTTSLRIVHYLCSLGTGGAERQLVYLARASVEAGHRPVVWTAYPFGPDSDRQVAELAAAGVEVRALELHPRTRASARSIRQALPAPLVEALARHAVSPILLPLVEALLAEPPDVLHAWLDEGNAAAGLAGLATAVPRIVLSGRGMSPLRMPHLDRPWLRDTYRALARTGRALLLNNSRAGADDYAGWLGLPPGSIEVVPNGLPLERLRPADAAERRALRDSLAIPEGACVVAGLFRLSPEKRPLAFLEVVGRASREVPIVTLLAGDGPLADAVRRRAQELGLGSSLRLLGALRDPWSTLRAADLTLLVSSAEGLPNVVLESQACGVPVVVTRVGGAPEAIDEGASGISCPPEDLDGLAGAVVSLARDPARRAAMGRRGRAFVGERFALERTLARTLALYSPNTATPKKRG